MHARLAGDREQQRAARHRGDRRDRVALLDEDVEHATGERRAHRRVAELHVERRESRLGLGEQRRRLLAARARFVLGAVRRGVAGAQLVDAPLLDARVAQLDARRVDRRARLAHLGFEQVALQLDQHLARLRPCRSRRRGSSRRSRRCAAAPRLRVSGSTVPVATTMRSMRPRSTAAVGDRLLVRAARAGGDAAAHATSDGMRACEAPDTASAHGGTSLRACSETSGDGADAIGGRRGGNARASIARIKRDSNAYTVVWSYTRSGAQQRGREARLVRRVREVLGFERERAEARRRDAVAEALRAVEAAAAVELEPRQRRRDRHHATAARRLRAARRGASTSPARRARSCGRSRRARRSALDALADRARRRKSKRRAGDRLRCAPVGIRCASTGV